MVNPQDAANDGGRDLECARRESRTGLLPLFLLVGFLLFVFTNRDGDVARNQYEDIIRDFDHQLSNYSAWLNGTATDFTLVRSSQFSRRLGLSNPSPPLS